MKSIASFGGIVSVGVEKHVQKFVSVTATARLHLDLIPKASRASAIKSLLRGYCEHYSGMGVEVYKQLCYAYGINPTVLTSGGDFIVPQEHCAELCKAMTAAWLLCPTANKQMATKHYIYARKSNNNIYRVSVRRPPGVEWDYFWNIYTAHGLGPDPVKVEAAIQSLIRGDIIEVKVE